MRNNFKIVSDARGDTIMEVLISVAVLGLMMATSFALTTKNQQTNRASQERTEALRIAEQQIEQLRSYYSNKDSATTTLNNTPNIQKGFCFNDAGVPVVNNQPVAAGDANDKYDTICKKTSGGYSYNVNVWSSSSTSPVRNNPNRSSQIGGKDGTYAITVRWDSAKNTGQDEVKMFYSIDDVNYAQVANATAGGTGVNIPECSDGIDNGDGDNMVDTGSARNPTTGALYPADPGCSDRNDLSEFTPPGLLDLSDSSIDFKTYHLHAHASYWLGRTQNVTLTNNRIDTINTITSITSSDSEYNFRVEDPQNCRSKKLSYRQSCTITIRFAPLNGNTGGTNNRFSNTSAVTAAADGGYLKANINIVTDGGSQSIYVYGRTVSDTLGPGDMLDRTHGSPGYELYPMNWACYNDVNACSNANTFLAGNWNLMVGGRYCASIGGTPSKLVMDPIGNLTYGPASGGVTWHSDTYDWWRNWAVAYSDGIAVTKDSPDGRWLWWYSNGGCS